MRLFQHSQTNLNQLSRRYLEFYYETVLQESPRSPVHDTVYLSFLVNDNAPHALVNPDEYFIGGEYANGENILYSSQEALLVNKAQIQKLFTIFTERNELNIYGRRKYLISNVLASEIPMEQVRPQPSLNEKAAFPIFGESQREKSVYERTMLDARLGFAVASPSFFLQEGRRQVSVTFVFDPSSLANLRQVLRDLSLASGDSGEEVFIKSFLEAFQLEITCPEGWYPIRKYVVNRVKTKVEEEDFSALSLRFDLERNEPPFVAYQAAIHGGQYQTNHPLLKILLNSQSYIYPYSLLNELVLTQIDISTQVKELKNLQLYSEIGPLDAANPFFPFGAVPNVGSYLIVGSAEIFQKSLNHLALHIEWFNLPRDSAGFGGYYQDYKAGLDNAAFEVKLSILEDGRWKPEMPEEQQDFKLFRTKRTTPSAEDASTTPQAFGMLSPYTHLEDIDVVRMKLPHNFEEMYKPNAYSNTARRGFLKIELSQPELAFGHSLYPTVLSEIVTENAKSSLIEALKRGFAKKQPKKLPNTPYNPQIKSLSLDYASSSVITLNDRATHATQTDRGRFYHILPFGEHQVYPDQGAQHIFLLPEIRYQGALLIGLSQLHPPQSLSILFEMAQTGSDSSEEVPPVLEWSYLSEDQWRVLPESKILRDETSQFIRTGIVVIDLPREMQKGNQTLDASLHWLRIAAIEHVQNASPLRSLCTQVIKASLVNLDEEGKHLQKPLPAFTITRSINNLIGIQRIMQPLPSFGGQAHESQKSFYTRLSERLRHKQRAITAWDYERLILERFAEVQKATCLSNMSSQASHQANSVLIVVSPYPKALNEREGLASREKLYEIKEYLKPFLSPFVKLEVRNPAYERIKIICAVKMIEGYQYGLYLQKLNDALNDYLKRDLLQGGKT
ncbi:MAG: hypothetical protein HC913_16265 [Microscillaceae bacterium]|nr:hypothetical protein [Microscillaceae bacterium]